MRLCLPSRSLLTEGAAQLLEVDTSEELLLLSCLLRVTIWSPAVITLSLLLEPRRPDGKGDTEAGTGPTFVVVVASSTDMLLMGRRGKGCCGCHFP